MSRRAALAWVTVLGPQRPRCHPSWRPRRHSNETDSERTYRRQPEHHGPDGQQPDRHGTDRHQSNRHRAQCDQPNLHATCIKGLRQQALWSSSWAALPAVVGPGASQQSTKDHIRISLRARTVARYTALLRDHVRPHVGARPLKQPGPHHHRPGRPSRR